MKIKFKKKPMEDRIKHFEEITNFHDKELIKQYLEKQDKEEQNVINKIPKIKCPHCRSKKIEVDYGESEYDNYTTLYCESCDHDFEDKWGYIDALRELECLDYGDEVMTTIWFLKQDINDPKWQNKCKELMIKYLNEGESK